MKEEKCHYDDRFTCFFHYDKVGCKKECMTRIFLEVYHPQKLDNKP